MENQFIARIGRANIWLMVLVMNVTGWLLPIFFPELSVLIYQTLFPPYVPQIEKISHHFFVDYGHRILGGFLFLLGALQFETQFRKSYAKLHRLIGYSYIAIGMFIAVSASYLAIFVPFSGFSEAVLVSAISLVYVVYLYRALKAALVRNIILHREWMIRGYAVVSFIYVMRIFSHVFYYCHVNASGPEIFITSSTLAFGINCFVAEWWINRTRLQK